MRGNGQREKIWGGRKCLEFTSHVMWSFRLTEYDRLKSTKINWYSCFRYLNSRMLTSCRIYLISLYVLFLVLLVAHLKVHGNYLLLWVDSIYGYFRASQVVQWERIHLPMQETQEMRVQSLGREDSLEEEMVTHSSILAWRIPRTEKPGGLYSPWGRRVRPDWAHTHFTEFLLILKQFKLIFLVFLIRLSYQLQINDFVSSFTIMPL